MVYNSPVRRVVYDNAQSATEPHTTRGWGAVLMSWFSKSFVTAVVACGLAAAAASPAVAQGLINGDFSSSLSNWDVAPDGSLANTGSSLTVTNDFLTSGPDTTTIWSNTKSGTFAYVWSGQDGEYTTLSQKFSAVAGSVVSAYVAFATTDWYGDASYNDDAYLTLSKAGSATPVRSWTASVQNFYDSSTGALSAFTTGWTNFVASVASSGDYVLTLGVRNVGDSGSQNSYALLDGVQVTNVPGPIAGAGLPALLALVGIAFVRRARRNAAA